METPIGDDEEWDGDSGFIHLSVDKHLAANSKYQAFLCGPPPMIDAVDKMLYDLGVEPDMVVYDKF